MIIVIGGGNLAKIIKRKAILQKIPVKVISTNYKFKKDHNKSLENNLIEENKLISISKKVIIVWSHTYIKDYAQFKKSIEGMKNILEFIKNNPEKEYIYISSTSAEIDYNFQTLYGLSKYIHESLLLDLVKKSKNFKIKILRLGLIYGMANCPLKKIVRLRMKNIKLILGNERSIFSVISSDDLANNLINQESTLWKERYEIGYLREDIKCSINKIHMIYNSHNLKNKFCFLTIKINKKSIIYKILKFLGIRIDLSLSEIDRFPISNKIITYDQVQSIENYINQLKNK